MTTPHNDNNDAFSQSSGFNPAQNNSEQQPHFQSNPQGQMGYPVAEYNGQQNQQNPGYQQAYGAPSGAMQEIPLRKQRARLQRPY